MMVVPEIVPPMMVAPQMLLPVMVAPGAGVGAVPRTAFVLPSLDGCGDGHDGGGEGVFGVGGGVGAAAILCWGTELRCGGWLCGGGRSGAARSSGRAERGGASSGCSGSWGGVHSPACARNIGRRPESCSPLARHGVSLQVQQREALAGTDLHRIGSLQDRGDDLLFAYRVAQVERQERAQRRRATAEIPPLQNHAVVPDLL